ncbi:MAG: DUF2779 domain-containing protein [Malacoplasma sp.]
MKKTNYINKYDFINYFSRPMYFWFLSNTEITSIIEAATEKYWKNNDFLYEDENDEDDIEYDAYEVYCQAKENNEKMDDNNPQIFEGRIIDNESKKYIRDEFDKISNVIDFDDKEYKRIKQEEIALITKEKILNNKDIILFQPVFIYKCQITKPDALIKIDNDIYIIETKGTSTTKIVHFLDLLFQKRTIEKQDYVSKYHFYYKLCIIGYCKLNKNQVSFSITDHLNYKKTLSFPKRKEDVSINDYLEMKRNLKLGIDIDPKNFDDYSLNINDALNGNFTSILYKKEVKSNVIATVKSITNSIKSMERPINEFDEIVSLMDATLKKFHITWENNNSEENINTIIELINLTTTDKNPYKNVDLFISLKPIYIYRGYDTFRYSGNVTVQNSVGIQELIDFNISKDVCVPPIFKRSNNNPNFYTDLFSVNSEQIIINNKKAIAFMSKIKSIKVFFDFETINTAIRSVDNSYPFTQVVTQCSILKVKGDKELSDCENLICDPKDINIEWYKQIVDSLYMSDDLMDDTSYIVYNKTFEDLRLREIAEYLDNSYKNKIEKIRRNIIDLADLFRISTVNGYVIFLKDLCGFYSIKKVLPIIESNNPSTFEKAKCVNYKKLEVGNGKLCQEKTTLRFFDVLSDQEWKELALNLQKYCENDVRAMLAIELYVKDILEIS